LRIPWALVQPNAGASVHGKARLLFAIRTPIYRMVMKVGAINLARTVGAINDSTEKFCEDV
jgi:hypothetical protein